MIKLITKIKAVECSNGKLELWIDQGTEEDPYVEVYSKIETLSIGDTLTIITPFHLEAGKPKSSL